LIIRTTFAVAKIGAREVCNGAGMVEVREEPTCMLDLEMAVGERPFADGLVMT